MLSQCGRASPDAQTRVAEIQAFAELVRNEFKLDLQRAAEKRASILSLLDQGSFWRDWRWVSLAAAALLAISAVVAAVVLSPRGTVRMAEKDPKLAARTAACGWKWIQQTQGCLRASPAARAATAPRSSSCRRQISAPVKSRLRLPHRNPRSTFPVQVDTAAYAQGAPFHQVGLPSAERSGADRGMINYFSYDYPEPEADRPFSVNLDAATCPWQPGHELVRIGLRGREIANENRRASNLVFLLDVSGSMQTAEALPLVQSAIRLLVQRLTANDRVAIVLYAGASGVALPSTPGDRKEEILRALEELEAGALSGGVEGIELAYRIAAENFVAGGVNRVIVVTDGELNVGVASERELVQMAKKKARAGRGADDAARWERSRENRRDAEGGWPGWRKLRAPRDCPAWRDRCCCNRSMRRWQRSRRMWRWRSSSIPRACRLTA